MIVKYGTVITKRRIVLSFLIKLIHDIYLKLIDCYVPHTFYNKTTKSSIRITSLPCSPPSNTNKSPILSCLIYKWTMKIHHSNSASKFCNLTNPLSTLLTRTNEEEQKWSNYSNYYRSTVLPWKKCFSQLASSYKKNLLYYTLTVLFCFHQD